MSKLITIGELSKVLNLVNKNMKPATHILRYWEKEFKQIKPRIINKRRYYSSQQAEVIMKIKFLLKDKGMTISGVKSLLIIKINKLDDYDSHSLKAEYYKLSFKEKSTSLLKKIKRIKNYGKKNSSKS
jgi:DNA-binding transcriptional MerR regulator